MKPRGSAVGSPQITYLTIVFIAASLVWSPHASAELPISLPGDFSPLSVTQETLTEASPASRIKVVNGTAHDMDVETGTLVGNSGVVDSGAQFGVQPPSTSTKYFESTAVGSDNALFYHDASTGEVYRFDTNPGGNTMLQVNELPTTSIVSSGTAAVTASDGSTGMMFYGYRRAPVAGAPLIYAESIGPNFVVVHDLQLDTTDWGTQLNNGYLAPTFDWGEHPDGLVWHYNSSTVGDEVIFVPNTEFEIDGTTARQAYTFDLDGAPTSSIDPATSLFGVGAGNTPGGAAFQNPARGNLFLADDGGDDPGDIGWEMYMLSQDGTKAIGYDLNKNAGLTTTATAINMYSSADNGFDSWIHALTVTDDAGNDLGTEMVMLVPGDGRIELFDVNPNADSRFSDGWNHTGFSEGGRNAWHRTLARTGEAPVTNGDNGMVFVADFRASPGAAEDSQIGYYRKVFGGTPEFEKLTLNSAGSARPFLNSPGTIAGLNGIISFNANFTDASSAVGDRGRELALLQADGNLLVFDFNPGPGGSFPLFEGATDTFWAFSGSITGSEGTDFTMAVDRELVIIEKASGNIRRFDLFEGPTSSNPDGRAVRGAEMLIRATISDEVGTSLGLELVVINGLTFETQQFDLNSGPQSSNPSLISFQTVGGESYDFYRVTVVGSAQLEAIGVDGNIGHELAALDVNRGLAALMDGGPGSTHIGFTVRASDGARIGSSSATLSDGDNTVTFFAAPIADSWGAGGNLPDDPTIEVSFTAAEIEAAIVQQNAPFFGAAFDSTSQTVTSADSVVLDFAEVSDPNGDDPYLFVTDTSIDAAGTAGLAHDGRSADSVSFGVEELAARGLGSSGGSTSLVVTAFDGRDVRSGTGVNANWDILFSETTVPVDHTNTAPSISSATVNGAPVTGGETISLSSEVDLVVSGVFADPDLAGNAGASDFESLTWDLATDGGTSVVGMAQGIGGTVTSGAFAMTVSYADVVARVGSMGTHSLTLSVVDAAGAAASTLVFELELSPVDPCDVAGGAPDVDGDGVGDECYEPPSGCGWAGCEASAMPGAGDLGVETCVCGSLPSCCTDAWTVECVRHAIDNCGLTCPAAPSCCDDGHPGSGCGSELCEDCVCDADPVCCTAAWDSDCAALSAGACQGACGCYDSNPPVCQLAGDLNGSGATNVADAICGLLAAVAYAANGLPPTCLGGQPIQSMDTNCDCAADVSDTIILINLALGDGVPSAIDSNGDNCADACQ